MPGTVLHQRVGSFSPSGTLLRCLPFSVALFLCACGSSEQPTPLPCTYTVTVSPAAFGPSGGNGSATVATGGSCSWTARADNSWVTIVAGASGTGPGTVTFTVAANQESAARSGSLTIAGNTQRLQQDGAPVTCAFSIAPASATFGKDGGTSSVSVATSATCAWTAAPENTPWVTVSSGQSGTGNGTVGYSVSKNTTTTARNGTLRIAGQAFGVLQSADVGACQYSVAPVVFSACMPAIELTAQIATESGCPWTAAPGNSWITVTAGSSGTGNGSVRFRIGDNYDDPRSGTVLVRWPAATAGQNLQIAQAGCHYAVSRDTITIAAGGGTATFDVLQQSEPYTCGGPLQNACLWTATADVSWITITSSMPRSGDDRVSFTVAANTGVARTGTITVRNKTVRVSQTGI